MSQAVYYWPLTLVPSLPLLFLYFAFRRVLVSKKFEMEMLLKRGETLTKYLSAYGGAWQLHSTVPLDEPRRQELISDIVDQIFALRYSTLEYVYAIAFSIVVTVTLMILAFLSIGISLGLPISMQSGLANSTDARNVVAGGIGAFIWGFYELSERYRSEDFPPDALFTLSSKLLVVGAVGAVIGAVINDRVAWPIAFGVGALPMSAVKGYIVERTRKALKIPEPSGLDAKPPLRALQGWNVELSEKLARAGVFSVQGLACTNQFQLFLHCNLEWRVILDLSDQALLILYIGEAVEKLYPLGIRSAVELAEIDWSKDDKDYFSDGLSRDQAIQSVASALQTDEQSVKLLIRSVSEDATVNFLGALWSDDTPDDDDDSPPSPTEPKTVPS